MSSQPLCFSVFGHLEAYREAAARVLDAVLPWRVDQVEDVVVEHAPDAAGRRLGGGRADRAASDAMLAVSSGGDRLLVGVETKYTEPFSQYRYCKDSYRQVCESPRS